MFVYRFALCGSLLFALLTSSIAQVRPSVDEARLRETFQRLGDAYLKTGNTDGMSVAVVQAGKTRFYNFGTISREHPVLPTQDSVYEIGSVSKVLTSLVLAHAVSEGKVRLSDDIRRYLPGKYPKLEWEGVPVTLKELDDRASGLPDNIPSFNVPGTLDEKPFRIAERLNAYSDAELLKELKGTSLLDRPGHEFRHSNLAAVLMRLILERVYHQPYPTLLARYVERPFGMQKGSAARAYQVTGYNGNHVKMPMLDAPYMLAGAGLKYSAADMAKFLQGELAAAEKAVQLSQRVEWGDVEKSACGGNWTINRTPEGYLHYRMSGGTFGFGSYIEMYPELGYGVVLLANRNVTTQDDMQKIAENALNALFGQPSIDVLKAKLEQTHFVDVDDSIRSTMHSYPRLHLTDEYVNGWAYDLLHAGRTEEALALFAYNNRKWPEDWNTWDSLAEAYAVKGDKTRAIELYRKSLELNPKNTNGVEQLKKLGVS